VTFKKEIKIWWMKFVFGKFDNFRNRKWLKKDTSGYVRLKTFTDSESWFQDEEFDIFG